MTRARTPRDLRERMERVAAKSRQAPESGPSRRSGRRAAPQRTDTQRASQTLDVGGAQDRSRLETFLAWGTWELTVVPAQRWKWFMAATRSRETPGHDGKRSD
jgi:hypothetical protein